MRRSTASPSTRPPDVRRRPGRSHRRISEVRTRPGTGSWTPGRRTRGPTRPGTARFGVRPRRLPLALYSVWRTPAFSF
eukprot:11177353-Lingulodinium_polyedra.AAC.1